ncbi:unnamed protein product [Caenorhabditis angaria]|uniref:Cullin-2 n=1 Tax=Caenorhabditis angaria TaxID=860376 RepID=A0A9P1IGN5_9PELO|nr:unnamed protein product [Caenorhabditis angaria]
MYSLKPKPVDFENVWSSLRPSVVDIMNMKPISSIQWHHKFSDVYDICVSIPNPLSEKLYNEVKTCIKDHVKLQRKIIENVEAEQLLQEYFRMWTVFHEGAVYVHQLFGYLNKQFVKQKRCTDLENYQNYAPFLQAPDVKEIGCLALEIWREDLVNSIQSRLVQLLLIAIDEDRRGNTPAYSDVVAGVIKSFVQMEDHDFDMKESTNKESSPNKSKKTMECTQFYKTNFEASFLKDTEMYYSNLAQKMLVELSCSEYMEAVIQQLEQEEMRAKKYLTEASVRKVIELCQKVMIKAHKEKLHAVCHDLITNEENKDLRNMYRLLKPIQAGLSVMVKEFEDYVKQKGLEAISRLSGENVPQQFVENVLKVYNKFNDMKTAVFMDDGEFSSGLDKALQGVVNAKEVGLGNVAAKASERLARYTDGLLKKTSKGISDTDLETKLTSAIVIFRYIEDKDIFQKFYSKMLANRLITNTSISMDSEENMINKLKQACGYEFTSKLSRMFLDIGLSHELSTQFEAHLTEVKKKDPKLEFVSTQTLILQAGSWPLSAPQLASGSNTSQTAQELADFRLPRVLQPCIQEFEEFYTSKHSGRKLTWLWNMSQGDIRFSYLDKQYVVTMYCHQIAVLMCFERSDLISVKQISESIGITGDYLLKVLKTIVDASILLSDSTTISQSSNLRLNLQMTSRRIKFRLQMPQINKTVEKEGQEAVANTVSQDRKYYMECAIVRIMKTRKVLKHNALVTEIMDQTKGRFMPDIPFIKKSIEDLIEKMYIQRTDQNDEYQYLA